MRKFNFTIITSFILLLLSFTADAQLKTKVVNGQIVIDDGSMVFRRAQYKSLADSLDKNIKAHPNDTTSLFFRALIYLRSNDAMAKPAQRTKGALEDLTVARNMAEKANDLKMKDFRLKVLRAGIYKELVYRFTGDESWMFNSKQIAERKSLFDNYKVLTNKYYNELALLDSNNAYDYQKLKVKDNYPLSK
ncbi:hypothetical protein SAMN05421821_101326 [Mucilaginibacter lappiensis]|uniref:Uncharacterized protein n=1 Tax=Mucilaginibacter lappiensis TaxID=354630 RepID=A0ABR6PEU3_9SPHI|nr:hypothetical protein [Mucilaginibacter lappiensis]MBB6107759.1 hypothetical protein [Mucilaginibacter lappiensis]SIP98019.1 hypothetical protein SAMN05421821_101326 [Mucilaginibacter lappiensis]